MQLSAIVPTLNEERQLPALLDRLRAEVDEIVVSDGGSGDSTAAIAREAGVNLVQGAHGRGPQLAAGARAARGALLWFVHADAGIAPGSGQAIRSSSARWACFEALITSSDFRLRFTSDWMNRRARLSGSATGDMGIWMRRELLDELGGVPELMVMEDLVLSDRARARCAPAVLGPPIGIDPRRWEETGISRTILRMWALRLGFRLGVDPERLAAGWVGWNPRGGFGS